MNCRFQTVFKTSGSFLGSLVSSLKVKFRLAGLENTPTSWFQGLFYLSTCKINPSKKRRFSSVLLVVNAYVARGGGVGGVEENQSISIHLLNGGSPKIRKTTTACGCAPCQVIVFHSLQRPGCEQHTRTHICERATYCLFLERREGKRKYKQAGAIFSRVFSPGNSVILAGNGQF